MTKTVIKKLAEKSFTKNNINSKIVTRIADSLKREDLKVYIKDLKNIDAKKKIIVTVPSMEGIKEIKDYFFKVYPDKRIIFNIDETLIAGIKVEDYDNVYELSLKSLLENSVRGAFHD